MKKTLVTSWEQFKTLTNGQDVWSVVYDQEVNHDRPIFKGKEQLEMQYWQDGSLLSITTERALAHYEEEQWDSDYHQFVGDGHILQVFLLS